MYNGKIYSQIEFQIWAMDPLTLVFLSPMTEGSIQEVGIL